MKTRNSTRLAVLLSLFALLVAACGNQAGTNGAEQAAKGKELEKAKEKDPVTIKLYVEAPYLNDDEVKTVLTDPLQKKYPHIQLQVMRPTKEATLETMIAANDIPDLHISWNGALRYLTDLGIVQDLEPLLKKEQFDLSRFEPSGIDAMKNEADDGKLYGIPYTMNFQLMYYNKDLFDHAGIPYPTDGMNWDETIELGKKLSGKLGTPYTGLQMHFNEMRFQLSLPIVDPQTKKAAITSEQWKKVFDTANRALKASPTVDVPVSFGKDRNVAIWAAKNRNNTLKEASENGLKWDVVQYPSFPEKPGVGSQVDAHVIYMSPTSKHKEDALQVIRVLTSDEVQEKFARIGKLPVLKDKAIINQFAADIPYLKDKNWKGVFKSQFGLPDKRVIDESLLLKFVIKAFDDYSKGTADMNTALRVAAEQVDQVVKEKLGNR